MDDSRDALVAEALRADADRDMRAWFVRYFPALGYYRAWAIFDAYLDAAFHERARRLREQGERAKPPDGLGRTR